MRAPVVYTIAYAAALAILFAWRLSQSLAGKVRERLVASFSKWVIYSVIFPRMNGSSDVTIITAIVLAIFIVANIVGCILSVQTRLELSIRLAKLCVTNAVFLYLGGRSNLVLDKVFRFSLQEHHLLHRWIGRVSVTEALIHGTMRMLQSSSRFNPMDISLLATVGSLAFFSFVYVRRRAYELFLQLHTLGSIAAMVLLWLHVPRLDTYTITCLSTAGGLYILQKSLWIGFMLYRNIGMGPQCRLSASHYTQPGSPSQVCQLRVDVKRGWKVKPGQFVYLSIPALRVFGLGIIEAHPFMVAWTIDDDSGRLKTIVLIVESQKGFTQRLKMAHGFPRAFIDGPYGGSDADTLGSYDKVLLLSSGIGIAAHLNTARYLLLAHNKQTARVRRLTIAWLLESQDQMRWAEEFLSALDDLDHREILTIFVFYPSEVEEVIEEDMAKKSPRRRMLPMSSNLDMKWFIDQEWGAEAGNMLLSVCGSTTFELRARQAVRSSCHDIDFKNCAFQPGETAVSRNSRLRYTQGGSAGE